MCCDRSGSAASSKVYPDRDVGTLNCSDATEGQEPSRSNKKSSCCDDLNTLMAKDLDFNVPTGRDILGVLFFQRRELWR
jgi:hypothetical protein